MSDVGHRDRLLRIVRIVADAGGHDSAGALCRASVEVLGVAGASTMIMSDGEPHPLCASNSIAARLEDLQHTLGEGPSIDAHERGRAVSEPNLATPLRLRWPAFGLAAAGAGAGAVFSYPLRIGGVRLGALTLYQRAAGALTDDQDADARTLASVVTNAILTIQARADPGALSPALELLASGRAEVHQAAGMLSVQLGIGVGEALVRLRAYAFSSERALTAVAADVVAGRLRLDE
jgi:hypothetical protein